MKEYNIFTSRKLGSIEVKNRVVMSPMTRSRAIVVNKDLTNMYDTGNWTLVISNLRMYQVYPKCNISQCENESNYSDLLSMFPVIIIIHIHHFAVR